MSNKIKSKSLKELKEYLGYIKSNNLSKLRTDECKYDLSYLIINIIDNVISIIRKNKFDNYTLYTSISCLGPFITKAYGICAILDSTTEIMYLQYCKSNNISIENKDLHTLVWIIKNIVYLYLVSMPNYKAVEYKPIYLDTENTSKAAFWFQSGFEHRLKFLEYVSEQLKKELQ